MKWHPSGPALFFGGICACFSGCSVGPAYKRPDIASPAQWHESASADGVSSSVWPAAEWWHGFGSAKLDELIAEANNRGGEDNITVILARFSGDELEEPASDRITIELPPLEEDMTLDDSYESDTEPR